MDEKELWSHNELNKFIRRKTKELCEAHGFVISPRYSKNCVRVKEHVVQVIYPNTGRRMQTIDIGVASASGFRMLAGREVELPGNENHNQIMELEIFGDPNGELDAFRDERGILVTDYHMLAVDPWVSKAELIYKSDKMKEVWDKVVVPYIEEEVFSFFDAFGFDQFFSLCESSPQRYGALQYGCEPGIDDATMYMSRGHIKIWQGNVGGSIPLLERALSGYEQDFMSAELLGYEPDDDIQKEYDAVKELLSVIKQGGENTIARTLDHMRELERIALNMTWGVAQSPEGETVRLKKKDRL